MESLKTPNAIRSETKAKLDAILKTALKKKTQSQQQLVSDVESIEDEEAHVNEAVEVDVHLSVENKSYILDKFLNDSNREQESIVEGGLPKMPVPKPRQNKAKVDSSEGSDVISNRTFDLSDKEPPKASVRKVKTSRKDHVEIELEELHSDSTVSKVVESASLAESSLSEKKAARKTRRNRDEEIELAPVRAPHAKGAEVAYDYEHIVGISVHRTDKLLLDSYVLHPVVKVHIVDAESGEYLKKSAKSRNVLFFNENKSIGYIGPVMTQPYSLQEKRSLFPAWEETILINEDFQYFKSRSVILFFEIVDFLNTSIINSRSKANLQGWHKIAWAFLIPFSADFSNLNKKLRLQLYRPGNRKKLQAEKCEAHRWWQKRKLEKYPSTLHVTVRSVISPCTVVETLRSRAPHEVEGGIVRPTQDAPRDVKHEYDEPQRRQEISPQSKGQWSRLEGQASKLPNKCVAKFDGCDEGCLALRFSNDGAYLACSVLIDKIYTVVIYSVLELKEVNRLADHHNLVYSIRWSKDDTILVTSSSDCTVHLWDVASGKFIQMLPHPSFVYDSDISNVTIATACFDKFVRIWCSDDTGYELTEELKGHEGYVTSLCFNKSGSMLYTADSVGCVLIWKWNNERWVLRRNVRILDLKDVIINQILLHKRERRLLVNSRDNRIRLVDIRTGYVLQTYKGVINNRVHTTCTFTPCGTYVISGSENGEVLVWNTETGKIEHTYTPYNADVAVHCVHFHPKDDYMALCHYENSLPILLFSYQRECDDNQSGPTSIRLKPVVTRPKIAANDDVSVNFRDILKKMDGIISSN